MKAIKCNIIKEMLISFLKIRKIFLQTLISLTFGFWIASQAYGQDSLEDIFKVDYDTPLSLDLGDSLTTGDVVAEVKKKKKKVKRRVFFGQKTKKIFIKTGFRNKIVYETFYVLKKFVPPPEYTRNYYCLDTKKRKIVNSVKAKRKRYKVLHGPYKKMLGDQILEEGWFYFGMKHKRWVKLNRHDILQTKQYWWKGWPQESLLLYYDFEKIKLKEVIPVHYGEKEGRYWVFHQNGNIAATGVYKHDYKVGIWKEYYPNRRLKRSVIYSNDPFDFKSKPYIDYEWNKDGAVIYDDKKFSGTRPN